MKKTLFILLILFFTIPCQAWELYLWELVNGSSGPPGPPINASYVMVNAEAGLTAERQLAAGLALDLTDGGANSTIRYDFDPTELLGSRTWGDGSTDTIVWTWNRLTGIDDTLTFGDGNISSNSTFVLPSISGNDSIFEIKGLAGTTGLAGGQIQITGGAPGGGIVSIAGSDVYVTGGSAHGGTGAASAGFLYLDSGLLDGETAGGIQLGVGNAGSVLVGNSGSSFALNSTGIDINTNGDIANAGTIQSNAITTTGVFTNKYDALAYWTATQANTAGVTFDSISDGTPSFTFSDLVNIGADDAGKNLTIHSGGTFTLWDASDDTNVSMFVGNGTTILGFTGTLNATGLQVGGAPVLTAEADTLQTVTTRGATTATSMYVTGVRGAEEVTLPLAAAGWTLQFDTGGWDIVAGVMTKTASTATLSAIASLGAMDTPSVGYTYEVTIVVGAVSGTIVWEYGNVIGTAISTTGTKTQFITATDAERMTLYGVNTATCTISSISIKELTRGNIGVEGNLICDVIKNINSTTAITLPTNGNVNIGYDLQVDGGAVTAGKDGQDGSFVLYSEEGATDYTLTFQPGVQGANIAYTYPTALPTATGQKLTCTTAGVQSWTPTTFEKTFSFDGIQFVHTGLLRWSPQASCTIVSVYAQVNMAPVGANLIVDCNKNSVTTFTTQGNRPTITAGNYASNVALPDITALLSTDYVQIDVDQTGVATPGSDLTVRIIYTIP